MPSALNVEVMKLKQVRLNGGSYYNSKCHLMIMLGCKGEKAAAFYEQYKYVGSEASMLARLKPKGTLTEGLLGVEPLLLWISIFSSR